MIKNLIKVLNSRSMLKNINHTSKNLNDTYISLNKLAILKQQDIIFNYYVGQYLGCQEHDFIQASSYLYQALIQCKTNYTIQIRKILKLLIPFILLSHGKIFNFEPWLNKYHLPKYYLSLIENIIEGNLLQYDNILLDNELEILQEKTYVAWQLIRDIVNLQYCKKKILTIDNDSLERKKILKNSIIKLSEIDQITECDIASLINLGMIKGYISHTHGCVVLSKTNPFPNIYRDRNLSLD